MWYMVINEMQDEFKNGGYESILTGVTPPDGRIQLQIFWFLFNNLSLDIWIFFSFYVVHVNHHLYTLVNYRLSSKTSSV